MGGVCSSPAAINAAAAAPSKPSSQVPKDDEDGSPTQATAEAAPGSTSPSSPAGIELDNGTKVCPVGACPDVAPLKDSISATATTSATAAAEAATTVARESQICVEGDPGSCSSLGSPPHPSSSASKSLLQVTTCTIANLPSESVTAQSETLARSRTSSRRGTSSLDQAAGGAIANCLQQRSPSQSSGGGPLRPTPHPASPRPFSASSRGPLAPPPAATHPGLLDKLSAPLHASSSGLGSSLLGQTAPPRPGVLPPLVPSNTSPALKTISTPASRGHSPREIGSDGPVVVAPALSLLPMASNSAPLSLISSPALNERPPSGTFSRQPLVSGSGASTTMPSPAQTRGASIRAAWSQGGAEGTSPPESCPSSPPEPVPSVEPQPSRHSLGGSRPSSASSLVRVAAVQTVPIMTAGGRGMGRASSPDGASGLPHSQQQQQAPPSRRPSARGARVLVDSPVEPSADEDMAMEMHQPAVLAVALANCNLNVTSPARLSRPASANPNPSTLPSRSRPASARASQQSSSGQHPLPAAPRSPTPRTSSSQLPPTQDNAAGGSTSPQLPDASSAAAPDPARTISTTSQDQILDKDMEEIAAEGAAKPLPAADVTGAPDLPGQHSSRPSSPISGQQPPAHASGPEPEVASHPETMQQSPSFNVMIELQAHPAAPPAAGGAVEPTPPAAATAAASPYDPSQVNSIATTADLDLSTLDNAFDCTGVSGISNATSHALGATAAAGQGARAGAGAGAAGMRGRKVSNSSGDMATSSLMEMLAVGAPPQWERTRGGAGGAGGGFGFGAPAPRPPALPKPPGAPPAQPPMPSAAQTGSLASNPLSATATTSITTRERNRWLGSTYHSSDEDEDATPFSEQDLLNLSASLPPSNFGSISRPSRKPAATHGLGIVSYANPAELDEIEAGLINEYLAMAGGLAAQAYGLPADLPTPPSPRWPEARQKPAASAAPAANTSPSSEPAAGGDTAISTTTTVPASAAPEAAAVSQDGPDPAAPAAPTSPPPPAPAPPLRPSPPPACQGQGPSRPASRLNSSLGGSSRRCSLDTGVAPQQQQQSQGQGQGQPQHAGGAAPGPPCRGRSRLSMGSAEWSLAELSAPPQGADTIAAGAGAADAGPTAVESVRAGVATEGSALPLPRQASGPAPDLMGHHGGGAAVMCEGSSLARHSHPPVSPRGSAAGAAATGGPATGTGRQQAAAALVTAPAHPEAVDELALGRSFSDMPAVGGVPTGAGGKGQALTDMVVAVEGPVSGPAGASLVGVGLAQSEVVAAPA